MPARVAGVRNRWRQDHPRRGRVRRPDRGWPPPPARRGRATRPGRGPHRAPGGQQLVAEHVGDTQPSGAVAAAGQPPAAGGRRLRTEHLHPYVVGADEQGRCIPRMDRIGRQVRPDLDGRAVEQHGEADGGDLQRKRLGGVEAGRQWCRPGQGPTGRVDRGDDGLDDGDRPGQILAQPDPVTGLDAGGAEDGGHVGTARLVGPVDRGHPAAGRQGDLDPIAPAAGAGRPHRQRRGDAVRGEQVPSRGSGAGGDVEAEGQVEVGVQRSVPGHRRRDRVGRGDQVAAAHTGLSERRRGTWNEPGEIGQHRSPSVGGLRTEAGGEAFRRRNPDEPARSAALLEEGLGRVRAEAVGHEAAEHPAELGSRSRSGRACPADRARPRR